MTALPKAWVAVLALLLTTGAAGADEGRPAMGPEDRQAWSMAGMRAAHPDIRWRLEALDALQRNDAALARTYLERAAKYGDKPAQALLAELYWSGKGGAQDRALAYAWMDLAAERGDGMLAAWRERYWAELDAAGRERALQVGQQVYAEYGDAVARPRLERVMARERRRGTGSRTGATIGLRVYEVPAANTSGIGMVDYHVKELAIGRHVPRYYEDRFWKADQYWEWKSELLAESTADLQSGTVTVGEIDAQIAEDQPRR